MSTNRTDRVKHSLQALFLAFPSQDRSGTERQLIEVYRMAIGEFSPGFVEQGVARFVRGLVDRDGMVIRPTPAELARECRRLRDEAGRYERFSALRLPKPKVEEPEPTAEERQRGVEHWRRVRDEMVAEAAWSQGKGAWTPPTREQLEASRNRIFAHMAAKAAAE